MATKIKTFEFKANTESDKLDSQDGTHPHYSKVLVLTGLTDLLCQVTVFKAEKQIWMGYR